MDICLILLIAFLYWCYLKVDKMYTYTSFRRFVRALALNSIYWLTALLILILFFDISFIISDALRGS